MENQILNINFLDLATLNKVSITEILDNRLLPSDLFIIKNNNNDNAFKIFQCSICQSFQTNSLNEILSHYFKLNQEMNKLLSDNCLSLKEFLKLVINSLDFKNQNNKNQILMHILYEYKNKSNRNLSLINLNLLNHTNNNNNNTDKLLRRFKIKCNCCNKIENSFNSLKNHLITIKHLFLSKSLVYLRLLVRNIKLECNVCSLNSFQTVEIFQKHLINSSHVNKCLKILYKKKNNKRHLSLRLNNLIKIILVVNNNDHSDTMVKTQSIKLLNIYICVFCVVIFIALIVVIN